jgi:hypothetical protein
VFQPSYTALGEEGFHWLAPQPVVVVVDCHSMGACNAIQFMQS